MNPDDEDLAWLRAQMAPTDCVPPAASVAALHAAVSRRFAPPWRARVARLAVAGAAVFSVLGTSATAYALSGAVLPDPLRVALHGVGLPVDSVAVANAKGAEGRLQAALKRGYAAQIVVDADALERRLARLSPADRREVGGEAGLLLRRAESSAGENRAPNPALTGGPGQTGQNGDVRSSDQGPLPAQPARTGAAVNTRGGTSDGQPDGRSGPGAPTTTSRDDGQAGAGPGEEQATTAPPTTAPAATVSTSGPTVRSGSSTLTVPTDGGGGVDGGSTTGGGSSGHDGGSPDGGGSPSGSGH